MVELFFIDCHLRSDTEKINDLPKSSTPSVLHCIIPRVRNADIEIVTSPWTCLSLRQPKQQYPCLTATFQISHEYIQCWGREVGWLTCIQNPSCKRVWEKPVLSFPAFAVTEENTRSWDECWEPNSCMHCTLWRRRGHSKRRKKVFSKEGIPKGHSAIYTECLCLPSIHRLKPSPKVMGWGGGAFGMWLGHEVEPLWMGLVSF